MSQSVLWGLLSALSYGIADYVSQIAGRTIGVWRTSFYYYVAGFMVLSARLSAEPPFQQATQAPLSAWAAGIASGLLLLCAVVLFTQGLVKGQIVVVAPITATYGGVTTCLSVLLGERFSMHVLVGLIMLVGGASVVALQRSVEPALRRRSGLGWAAAAALDGNHVAVVVVLSSLTSAVTVLLARVFGSVRLAWYQCAALATIMAGLVLIHL